jgi:hypothetical protein
MKNVAFFVVALLLFSGSAMAAYEDGVLLGPAKDPLPGGCEVVEMVSSPVSSYSGGLAWDGEYLWVSDIFSGELIQFDFENEEIIRDCNYLDYKLRDLTWQAMDDGGGYLWAGTWTYVGRINKIDVESCEIVDWFDFPEMGANHCHGAAWNIYFGDEWRYELLLGEEDGNIYWVNPSTGDIDHFCDPYLGGYNPRGLAWNGIGIWAGDQDANVIRKYDDECNQIDVCTSSTAYQQGTTWDGHFLYTTGSNMMIAKMDVGYAVTNNIVQQGITVEAGSNAVIDIEIMNHTDEAITTDAWLDVYLPNGKAFGGNPLGIRHLRLPANTMLERTIKVKVPGKAPAGNYMAVLHTNNHPDPTHSDQMRVTVTK